MNLKAVLIAMLNPVLGGPRVWVDTVKDGMTPQQLLAPFLIIQKVGGSWNGYVDGTIAGDRNARIQFMVQGENRKAVDDMAEAIIQRLAQAVRDNEFVNVEFFGEPVDGFSDVSKLRSSRFDAGIWYRNVVP